MLYDSDDSSPTITSHNDYFHERTPYESYLSRREILRIAGAGAAMSASVRSRFCARVGVAGQSGLTPRRLSTWWLDRCRGSTHSGGHGQLPRADDHHRKQARRGGNLAAGEVERATLTATSSSSRTPALPLIPIPSLRLPSTPPSSRPSARSSSRTGLVRQRKVASSEFAGVYGLGEVAKAPRMASASHRRATAATPTWRWSTSARERVCPA